VFQLLIPGQNFHKLFRQGFGNGHGELFTIHHSFAKNLVIAFEDWKSFGFCGTGQKKPVTFLAGDIHCRMGPGVFVFRARCLARFYVRDVNIRQAELLRLGLAELQHAIQGG